eukprot:9470817-Pyramimonas_sp.AAC.1
MRPPPPLSVGSSHGSPPQKELHLSPRRVCPQASAPPRLAHPLHAGAPPQATRCVHMCLPTHFGTSCVSWPHMELKLRPQ